MVKNKLKRLKKTIDDDDMLNYLKYSHLDTSKKPHIVQEDDTENNQTHNLQLANIEPKKIETANKGVDTGDDFYKVIPPYVSLMYSEDFDRNEKMVQVWTRMFKQNLTPSPPSSSSSSSSKGSSESFTTKNIRRGFRLAEFAYNASVVGFNLTGSAIGTAIDISDYLFNNQQNEASETSPPQTVNSSPPQTVNSSSPSGAEGDKSPSPPQTINSSSSDVEEIPPLILISSSSSSRQTPSSIPQPTSPPLGVEDELRSSSPQPSTPASSAKTTPRKKSK